MYYSVCRIFFGFFCDVRNGRVIYSFKKIRYAIKLGGEILSDAHRSVDPYRLEGMVSVYPLKTDMGFFARYTYGHNDYNYRFLDSFHRISFGVVWDWFTPFEIQQAKKTGDEIR